MASTCVPWPPQYLHTTTVLRRLTPTLPGTHPFFRALGVACGLLYSGRPPFCSASSGDARPTGDTHSAVLRGNFPPTCKARPCVCHAFSRTLSLSREFLCLCWTSLWHWPVCLCFCPLVLETRHPPQRRGPLGMHCLLVPSRPGD